jgi:hypothetical protein
LRRLLLHWEGREEREGKWREEKEEDGRRRPSRWPPSSPLAARRKEEGESGDREEGRFFLGCLGSGEDRKIREQGSAD